MRKLGGLDAMFLYNETSATPMHVGSLAYLEVDDAKKATFFDDFKAMLLERIHLVPYLTSTLQKTPMNIDHPVWVRQELDLDEHVHRVEAESPGTTEHVEKLVARLFEPVLDRSKPLWQMWVIEGLGNGQIALLQKTHHACVDGASTIKAAELLFDLSPVPRKVQPAPDDFWEQDPPNESFELVRAAYENFGRKWLEGMQKVPTAFSATTKVTQDVVAGRYELPPMRAPKTSLNASIDGRRSFSNAEMSLTVMKNIAKTARVKINDVVLLICGEGLKRYFFRHGESPLGSLIGNCPVSLHKPGDASIKNQVTAMNVDMATGIEDLGKRLQKIHLSANGSKGAVAAWDGAMPDDFAAFGMPAALQMISLLNQSGIAFDLMPAVTMNVVVSNVPGFQIPLYVAGAKLVWQMPMSIVVHGAAVNLTVTSYCDRMDLGVTAATKRVPDVDNLRDDLMAAYEALASAILGEGHDLAPIRLVGVPLSPKAAPKARKKPRKRSSSAATKRQKAGSAKSRTPRGKGPRGGARAA